MADNEYTSRDEYLKKTVREYDLKIIGGALLIILYILIIIAVVLGWIIHWVKNDSFTFMQMLKWSFSNYWWAYIYIILYNFVLGDRINTAAHERDAFIRQQTKRNQEREAAIRKAEESSAYNKDNSTNK